MYKTLMLIVLVLFQVICAVPMTADEYKANIQSIMDKYAVATHGGFQFSVMHKDLNFTYATGVENHAT